MAKKNINKTTHNKEQSTEDGGRAEDGSETPIRDPLATAEPYAGNLYGVEITKGMKFSAADDGTRR